MSTPASTDADVALPFRTLAELLFFSVGRFPKPDLLGQCRDGAVTYTTARELLDHVRDVSLGLASLGVASGTRVAVVAESRTEWLVTDLAILAAGAVTTAIYPTLSAEQIRFILEDSGATLVVVSGAQLAKVADVVADLPAIAAIVAFEIPESSMVVAGRVPVVSLEDVATRGHDRIREGWGVAHEFQQAAERVRPGDLATIIYTSGTTAEPKGVMLSHGNVVSNLKGILPRLDLHEGDTGLSFLPLCHAFERMVAYVYLATGVSMVFAESFDTVARDLALVRPTVMSAVPRVFEKLYAKVMERGRALRGAKGAIFKLAIAVANRRGRDVPEGRPLPLWARAASPLVESQVFKKIHALIGGRLRFSVSGSAPLNPDIARFFYGMGLPILEGYGLTEAAPVLCLVPLAAVRFGTVGPPLPNVELKLSPDGEILARGPNVMLGYHDRPADTAATLVDGWLHTGDIGTLDELGYLRLTDRKKELLVTSGGKKIAPQPIEERLRTDPLVHQVVVVGDRRHFPGALIVPDFAALALRLGIDRDAVGPRLETAEVRGCYQAIVDRANGGLAQFERIKKFVFIVEEFTVASGELTPTMKVKRRVVEEKHRRIIDAMYT